MDGIATQDEVILCRAYLEGELAVVRWLLSDEFAHVTVPEEALHAELERLERVLKGYHGTP